MAVPRPALLAILGFLLIAGTFFATHRASDAGSSAAPAPVAAKPAPKPAVEKPAAKQPAVHKAVPANGGVKADTKKAVKHETPAAKAPVHKAPVHKAPVHKAPVHKAPAHKTPAAQKPLGASDGLPAGVAKAFAAHKVVVIFFHGSGADDAATAVSVRDLKSSSHGKVAVFSDKLSNLADYRRIVEGLDISQAPSIVVVGRDMKARLLEGFVDSGSLRQVVADVTG